MKIKEIILDFTSLLDVVMIILFFFVLYSTIDTDNKVKDKETYYNELIDENKKEQEEWREEASKEWARIESFDENAAASEEALNAFERGEFYKFRLDVIDRSKDWTLKISFNGKQIDEIKSNETDDVKTAIKNSLNKSDFSKNKKYICVFSYDGSQNGTAQAFDSIKKVIDSIQRQPGYSNLYFSNLNEWGNQKWRNYWLLFS